MNSRHWADPLAPMNSGRFTVESELRDVLNHPLDPAVCFLCANSFGTSDSTREDVFPMWLQHRHSLRDSHVVLLNGTSLPYRELKIPCCKTCNNEHLSRIEQRVADAVQLGVQAVRDLPEFVLFQWLVKLYVGVLFRELSLSADRRDVQAPTIVNRLELENARILWFWLRQELRTIANATAPGSIWIFRCLTAPGARESGFDFLDFHSPPTIGIRMGDLGIVADLLDLGLLKSRLADTTSDLYRIALSPRQFREAFVRIAYKAKLFGLNINVRAAATPDGEECLHFEPHSTVPGGLAFNEWDEREYASFLASRLGLSLEEVLQPDGRAKSWIYDGEDLISQSYE
jgi:hypothetical protein